MRILPYPARSGATAHSSLAGLSARVARQESAPPIFLALNEAVDAAYRCGRQGLLDELLVLKMVLVRQHHAEGLERVS